MAVEMLRGFNWVDKKAHERTTIELEFGELFALLAMNQDFGHELLPKEVWLGIQVKLAGAIHQGFSPARVS